MCVRVSLSLQNAVPLSLLESTWLRIEQFLPGFMQQLFPSVTPPSTPSGSHNTPAPPETTQSPVHNAQPQVSPEYPLESVVVQEVPITMTMDHVTGGVTVAANPIQTPCHPSRYPDLSPHASPPVSSSPG